MSAVPTERELLHKLIEAADALLSNEEHAVSAGMCSYAKGSPTWHCWEDLRRATNAAAFGIRDRAALSRSSV